jgi:hypothetical protein
MNTRAQLRFCLSSVFSQTYLNEWEYARKT